MIGTSKLLFNILVSQFYKLNSGFFLFIFLVLFGIVEPGQIVSYHLGLMQLVLYSVAGMGLAMATWMYYGYKCVSFVLAGLEKQENSFLINLQGLSASKQGLVLFCCQILIYLPILAYTGIAVSLGFQTGQVARATIILVFQTLICLGSAYLYYRKINGFHKKRVTFKLFQPNNVQLLKPFILFPVCHILYERKFVWLVLKAFSSFVFYLVFVLHRADFSLGYFRLLFLITILAHSMLVFYCFEFVEKKMAFTRNLPVSRNYRLLTYVVTYLIILLPEFCWMFLYAAGIMSWPEILLTYCAGIGQLLLLTALLYLPKMQLERFAWVICLIYFLSAILLSTSIAAILLVEVGVALLVFYRSYYRFQFDTSKT